MAIPPLFVVLHVLTVLWLVSGIVGRDTCYTRAARAPDLTAIETLIAMGGVFERTMVRPATFLVLLTGLLAAWRRGWPILGFLQGGSANWVLVALLVYLSIIPVIVFIFLPRGAVYRKAMAAAREQGAITPALRAALNDPAVTAARFYELLMVVVLVFLMVTRSF
jgi:hypothetical protein